VLVALGPGGSPSRASCWRLFAEITLRAGRRGAPTASDASTGPPVTYNDSGVVTRVTLSLGAAVGDRISGSFSIDTETRGSGQKRPLHGLQLHLRIGIGRLVQEHE
jgi:hypothetical protein